VNILEGNGRGDFNLSGSFNGLPFPAGSALDDLDGDGKTDYIFSSSSTDQISVFLSSSGIDREKMLIFQTGNQRGGPGDIVIGDFDGDGLRDIAVANSNVIGGTLNITIFWSFRNRSFSRIDNIKLDGAPESLIGGDFNGDGLLDLAAQTCCPESELLVLLSSRDRRIKIEKLSIDENSFGGLIAEDFNGDRITDLAFASRSGRDVFIVQLGANAQPSNIIQVQINAAYYLKTADIDSDGNTDLIVLNDRAVNVLLGRGNGTFKAGPEIRTSPATRLIISDFNSDKMNDLIIIGRDYIEPLVTRSLN